MGHTVKFYGVSGSEYFNVIAQEGEVSEDVARALAEAAGIAATALGLEAWGGDALVDGDRFTIVDFNDWPSFSRVRVPASRAIARRALKLLAAPAPPPHIRKRSFPYGVVCGRRLRRRNSMLRGTASLPRHLIRPTSWPGERPASRICTEGSVKPSLMTNSSGKTPFGNNRDSRTQVARNFRARADLCRTGTPARLAARGHRDRSRRRRHAH